MQLACQPLKNFHLFPKKLFIPYNSDRYKFIGAGHFAVQVICQRVLPPALFTKFNFLTPYLK